MVETDPPVLFRNITGLIRAKLVSKQSWPIFNFVCQSWSTKLGVNFDKQLWRTKLTHSSRVNRRTYLSALQNFLQSSHKQRTTRSATTTKQCAREAPDDGNPLEQLIMGQLISIPVSSDAAASDLDHRPKTISECMLRSGKVSIQLFHDFKKRSYEELDQHVADLLFTNSLLSLKWRREWRQRRTTKWSNKSYKDYQEKEKRKASCYVNGYSYWSAVSIAS